MAFELLRYVVMLAAMAILAPWIILWGFFERIRSKIFHKTIHTGDAIFVTGAGSGIGRYTALYLSEVYGYTVFASVHKEEDGQMLKKLAVHKEKMIPLVMEITDANSIRAAVQLVENHVGHRGLVGLFNNIGIAERRQPLEHLSMESMRRNYEINVFGTVAVIQAFLPLVRMAKGTIINNVSLEGRLALPFHQPYSSTKYALESISDSLRREVWRDGINVVIIEPGFVQTGLFDKLREEREREGQEALRDEQYPKYRSYLSLHHSMAQTIGAPPKSIAKTVASAVRSKYPLRRYQAAGISTMVWLLSNLPSAWQDWYTEVYLKFLPDNMKFTHLGTKVADDTLDFLPQKVE